MEWEQAFVSGFYGTDINSKSAGTGVAPSSLPVESKYSLSEFRVRVITCYRQHEKIGQRSTQSRTTDKFWASGPLNEKFVSNSPNLVRVLSFCLSWRANEREGNLPRERPRTPFRSISTPPNISTTDQVCFTNQKSLGAITL